MKKEELFSLVKSMSKSEKRYFKLFARQMGLKSNYVKLFAELDKQEVFDKKAIREKFAGEKFLDQLHVTKNYLRQLILKSLRNYHHKISKDAELKDSLRNLEILFNKELYPHCQTELKRAEQLARQYGLKTGLLEVINWKRKLEQTLHPRNYPVFKNILDEQEAALNKLQNIHEYWKMAVGVSSNRPREKEVDMSRGHLLSDPAQALSLEAKVLYYNARYIYYLQKGEAETAVEALKELIKYLERFPVRLKEDPTMYLTTVNNLSSYYIFEKEEEKAIGLLRKAKDMLKQNKSKSLKKSILKQIMRTYNIELEIYRANGSYQENAAFIIDMENFVSLYKLKMPGEYLHSFWFQFAYIYFMQKKYNEATKWVNQLMNTSLRKTRIDLQVQARMLNLMIHLELQNLFVLRYFVDSTRRYLKKRNLLKGPDKILLAFFSKIGKTPFYEWKDRFVELYVQLYPKGKFQVFDEEAIGSIDYEKWILANAKI